MNLGPGLFVVIEGPSGVGKSTVVEYLRAELAARNVPVVATKEPSDSALGKLARQGTDEYRGLASPAWWLRIGITTWSTISDPRSGLATWSSATATCRHPLCCNESTA